MSCLNIFQPVTSLTVIIFDFFTTGIVFYNSLFGYLAYCFKLLMASFLVEFFHDAGMSTLQFGYS